MDQPKKAKGSRSVKKEEVSPVETSTIPVQEIIDVVPTKPNPKARPKSVTVLESGLVIEEY
jgi:hypothetical protein